MLVTLLLSFSLLPPLTESAPLLAAVGALSLLGISAGGIGGGIHWYKKKDREIKEENLLNEPIDKGNPAVTRLVYPGSKVGAPEDEPSPKFSSGKHHSSRKQPPGLQSPGLPSPQPPMPQYQYPPGQYIMMQLPSNQGPGYQYVPVQQAVPQAPSSQSVPIQRQVPLKTGGDQQVGATDAEVMKDDTEPKDEAPSAPQDPKAMHVPALPTGSSDPGSQAGFTPASGALSSPGVSV